MWQWFGFCVFECLIWCWSLRWALLRVTRVCCMMHSDNTDSKYSKNPRFHYSAQCCKAYLYILSSTELESICSSKLHITINIYSFSNTAMPNVGLWYCIILCIIYVSLTLNLWTFSISFYATDTLQKHVHVYSVCKDTLPEMCGGLDAVVLATWFHPLIRCQERKHSAHGSRHPRIPANTSVFHTNTPHMVSWVKHSRTPVHDSNVMCSWV